MLQVPVVLHITHKQYTFLCSITFFMSTGLTALSFVLDRKQGLLERNFVAGKIVYYWRIYIQNFRYTPPPYGTQFFCFHIHFHHKAPASGPHLPPPPNGSMAPPLREILDPPLFTVFILNTMVCYDMFSRSWLSVKLTAPDN